MAAPNDFDQMVTVIKNTQDVFQLGGDIGLMQAGLVALQERLEALEKAAGITPPPGT